MGTYMVTHKARWLLQEIRNVFYYETTAGEPTDAEWQDIVDEIRADYLSEIPTLLSDEYVFYGIDRRRVDIAGLLSFDEVPTLGDWTGGATAESVATQVAMLISVKGTTVKPNRARTYLGGMSIGSLLDSLVTAGSRSAAEGFIDMQSVLNSAGTNELQRVAAQWNVNHTLVSVTNNIAGAASRASIVPATQRRRRIGVGI